MPFHSLLVTAHAADRPPGAFDFSRIRVVVSALDLFQALERSIIALQRAGWHVDDLEQFQIGVSAPSDPLTAALHHDARVEEGLAWAVANRAVEDEAPLRRPC